MKSIILYIKYFYCLIKLSIIPLRKKLIGQGLQFLWFFEHATKSGKISSETKLNLRSNSANVKPSCDLFLIYVMSLNNIKH